MWLLNTESLSLVEYHDSAIPDYGILSHRWQEEEVTFKDMRDCTHLSRKGYAKIKSCCQLAQDRGMVHVWIDTCCIDKSSSAELTEAINSMYQWYAKAKECYAYLSDVDILNADTSENCEKLAASAWFTRGWTLQELIAPSQVIFYNCKWMEFGTKNDMHSVLSEITSVDVNVLSGSSAPSSCSIAQRMSWASKRTTTRVEDLAYCLLGIFEVNMPLLYGEGSRAFFRLQRKIIKQLDDQTIFAWTDSSLQKPVFAPSPACFHDLQDLVRVNPTNDAREGYTLANSGLSIQIMLIPFGMNRYLAPLSCGYLDDREGQPKRKSIRGYERACIVLQQTSHKGHFVRVAHNDQDLIIKHADDIATSRYDFGLEPRRVFIQQQLPSLEKPLFHGFEFSFNHPDLFVDGKVPSAADVVCNNVWSEEHPVFELTQSVVHRAAGFFRFSGVPTYNKTIFMHLGFDLDFAPICVIRSESRIGRNDRKNQNVSLGFVSFGLLPKDSLDELLDLKWLLKIAELQQGSRETIVAFRGERHNSAEVVCKSLSLKLLFRVQFSQRLNCSVWHVTFDYIQPRDTLGFNDDPDETVYVRQEERHSRPKQRTEGEEIVFGFQARAADNLRDSDFRDSILDLVLKQGSTIEPSRLNNRKRGIMNDAPGALDSRDEHRKSQKHNTAPERFVID